MLWVLRTGRLLSWRNQFCREIGSINLSKPTRFLDNSPLLTVNREALASLPFLDQACHLLPLKEGICCAVPDTLSSRGSERASIPGITSPLRIEFAFRLHIKQELKILLLNKEEHDSNSYFVSWKSIKINFHHCAKTPHLFSKSTVQY